MLRDLQNGKVRFNELKEETGASSRTLSQALDALMDAGLVAKRMEKAAPVATYYTAGCKSVKNFAAPGRRTSSRSYSRQYTR